MVCKLCKRVVVLVFEFGPIPLSYLNMMKHGLAEERADVDVAVHRVLQNLLCETIV